MKVFKFNSFSTFFISLLVIGLVIFIPIVILETIWNGTVGQAYDYMVIDFWQALILWLIVLTIFNILGVFKFEFAIETVDHPDKEALKKKTEKLHANANEQDKDPIDKDLKDKNDNKTA